MTELPLSVGKAEPSIWPACSSESQETSQAPFTWGTLTTSRFNPRRATLSVTSPVRAATDWRCPLVKLTLPIGKPEFGKTAGVFVAVGAGVFVGVGLGVGVRVDVAVGVKVRVGSPCPSQYGMLIVLVSSVTA